ncbi:MAG: hypothetical protein AAAFM81_14725 [Pseudomonadota bacterium]
MYLNQHFRHEPRCHALFLQLKALLVLSLILGTGNAAEPEPTQRFDAVIPTVEQETDYVWRSLRDTRFFEANGYDVSLPDGQLIVALKDKARAGTLNDDDYVSLQTFMRESVYREEDYRHGYDKIAAALPTLNTMLSTIEAEHYVWGFRAYDQYAIILTLYGPGGSYDPDNATITMLTNTQGGFRQYANPLYTLIHEVVHIGIEESVIRKLSVPHGLKERLVDTFVTLLFADALPGYRVQQMGNPDIDHEFKDRDSLKRLPDIVREFLAR